MIRKLLALLLCVVLVLTVSAPMSSARTYSACDAPAYIAWAAYACSMCIAASIWTYGNVSGCFGDATAPPPMEESSTYSGDAKQPYEAPTAVRSPGDADGTSGARRK